MSEAPSHGLPAIIYDLKCSGSQAYIALAKEFLERSNLNVVNKKLERVYPLLGNKDISKVNDSENKGLLLIPIEKIFRDENQPRKVFDKEKINELAQSIKNGLIQPLIVIKKDLDNYILVAGERRWRAAQSTEIKVLPALLLPDDLDKDEISLIENIQREDLKVSEEAKAYQRLIEKIAYT